MQKNKRDGKSGPLIRPGFTGIGIAMLWEATSVPAIASSWDVVGVVMKTLAAGLIVYSVLLVTLALIPATFRALMAIARE